MKAEAKTMKLRKVREGYYQTDPCTIWTIRKQKLRNCTPTRYVYAIYVEEEDTLRYGDTLKEAREKVRQEMRKVEAESEEAFPGDVHWQSLPITPRKFYIKKGSRVGDRGLYWYPEEGHTLEFFGLSRRRNIDDRLEWDITHLPTGLSLGLNSRGKNFKLAEVRRMAEFLQQEESIRVWLDSTESGPIVKALNNWAYLQGLQIHSALEAIVREI